MNINQVFKEDQESFLVSKKTEFLESIKKECEETVNSREEELKALKKVRDNIYIKISSVGQSKTLDEFNKTSGDFNVELESNKLMEIELRIEVLEKEMNVLKSKLTDMFS